MKLPNLLDHPALNQLRLGMDAALVSIEKGWSPRLLNPEAIRRMGRPPTPPQMPTALGGQPPAQTKPKARPPTEYLREKGSKVLNPLEPVRGEVDWSSRGSTGRTPAPTAPAAQPSSAAPTAPAAQSASSAGAPPAGASKPQPRPESPSTEAPPSKQRKRRNQDALDRLKGL